MIRLEIKGEPIPAARPRISGRGMYQGARNRSYREEIQMAGRLAMKAAAPLTGALSAVVKLYRSYAPTSRRFGDVDNHLKAIFDGLNGIVFVDDAQIVKCVVTKQQDGKNPRAEISIQEVQS